MLLVKTIKNKIGIKERKAKIFFDFFFKSFIKFIDKKKVNNVNIKKIQLILEN